MTTITELRQELSKVFDDLRAGVIKPGQAAELNNTAGKIINSTKVELEYYALRKESPEIEFFKNK